MANAFDLAWFGATSTGTPGIQLRSRANNQPARLDAGPTLVANGNATTCSTGSTWATPASRFGGRARTTSCGVRAPR